MNCPQSSVLSLLVSDDRIRAGRESLYRSTRCVRNHIKCLFPLVLRRHLLLSSGTHTWRSTLQQPLQARQHASRYPGIRSVPNACCRPPVACRAWPCPINAILCLPRVVLNPARATRIRCLNFQPCLRLLKPAKALSRPARELSQQRFGTAARRTLSISTASRLSVQASFEMYESHPSSSMF